MWQKAKNIYHFFVAIVCNLVFLFPSRGMTVIGVTGTDGKTTTVNLIYHILKEADLKVSAVSTIGAVIGSKTVPIGFHVTTPGSFALQRLLSQAKKTGSKYFVLEITSHALDQHRITGIPIEIGVLTNVTSEHLDYHKTYDNYLKTKEILLKIAQIAVVNRDDNSYTMLTDSKNSTSKKNWITYGFFDSAEVNPKNFKLDKIDILGDFNKYNILAAVAVCRALGIKDNIIRNAIKTFHLPKGRLDYVYRREFGVMIDFAHTPNAFEQLLKSIRPITKGRIIHIFGSAGERDSIKRPLLGEISAKYCDIVILTAEDPRGENVNEIIEQIYSGLDSPRAEVIKIPDRRGAIRTAIQIAKKNDLVLITGKAQEESMNLGNGEEPWDEYRVVREVLEDIKKDEK